MGRWRPIFKACTLTQLKHEISIKIQICKNFFIRVNALKIIIEIFAFNFQLKLEIYTFLTIWEEAFLDKIFKIFITLILTIQVYSKLLLVDSHIKVSLDESQSLRFHCDEYDYMVSSAFTVLLFQFHYCRTCRGIPVS